MNLRPEGSEGTHWREINTEHIEHPPFSVRSRVRSPTARMKKLRHGDCNTQAVKSTQPALQSDLMPASKTNLGLGRRGSDLNLFQGLCWSKAANCAERGGPRCAKNKYNVDHKDAPKTVEQALERAGLVGCTYCRGALYWRLVGTFVEANGWNSQGSSDENR